MNHSTPALPVHHQPPKSTQNHVQWVSDAIQPSHSLSPPSPPALNLSQHQGLFQWISYLHQVAKVLEWVAISFSRGSSWPRDQTLVSCISGRHFNLWATREVQSWYKEPTHWKRPWCWERLRAGGEGGDREWDGWMASLTQWTWIWASSGSSWWTGKPGVLQSMGLQRVGHDWATELNKQIAQEMTPSRKGFSLLGLVHWREWHNWGVQKVP